MTNPTLNRLRMGADEPVSAEELRANLDAKTAATEAKDTDDPKRQRKYTFTFEHVSPDGSQALRGKFTNVVLSVGERMAAGALTSALLKQAPIQSVPQAPVQLAIAVGWMTYSLIERPDWAADLAKIDDEQVILKLYAEVWSHQNTFLGRPDDSQS